MKVLCSNDDGIYAPGLRTLANQMQSFGEVRVVAPATEQSGVGHAITYLTPLTCKRIHRDGKFWGIAVDGSPADCVKLAVAELFADDPVDVVVSGINHGLNAGINVLYSGTVAAAIEGAFFGHTSIAVSLEYDEDADFEAAAEIARPIIAKIIEDRSCRGGLFNINVPTAATRIHRRKKRVPIATVPMGLAQYGRSYESRTDPGGKPYYWALWTPPPPSSDPQSPEHPDQDADIDKLSEGFVTVTPLSFDMTHRERLNRMSQWFSIG